MNTDIFFDLNYHDGYVTLSADGCSLDIVKQGVEYGNCISLLDIDLFTDEVVIKKDNEHYFSRWCEILNFDVSQMSNLSYVKKKLFSPNARRYVKKEGLIIAIGILKADLNFLNYYLGLITLVGYRIAEASGELDNLVDFIIEKRSNDIISKDSIDAEEARWRISSTFVIISLSLKFNKNIDIIGLFKETQLLYVFVKDFPIMSQNYFSILIMFSLVEYNNSNFNEVDVITSSIFNDTKLAINKLYNENNKFFLSQTKDIQTLVDISKCAVVLNLACSNKTNSKLSKNFRAAPRVTFTLDKVLHRFGRDFNASQTLLAIATSVDNDYKKALE